MKYKRFTVYCMAIRGEGENIYFEIWRPGPPGSSASAYSLACELQTYERNIKYNSSKHLNSNLIDIRAYREAAPPPDDDY